MTQTGNNEKELVLGNRQLISLFFVGVALCGVFFAMGYMVGHNSSKTTLTPADTTQTPAPDTTARRQQPEPPRETVADSQPAPLETKPAADTPGVSQPDAAPPQTVAPAPAPAKEPPVRETKTTRLAVSEPETGTAYLQVTALPKPDADNMVQSLREQNFPVILATSSKENLFRVLVGPYRQTAQLADAKARLKTLGFANAFVQRQ